MSDPQLIMSDPQLNNEPLAMTYIIPPTNEPWGDILHPVTIFQLHQVEFEVNPLLAEGKDSITCTLVAHLTRVELYSSGLGASYTLEDGTGRISGFKNLDSLSPNDESSAEEEEIGQIMALEHTFVEVVGILKKGTKWRTKFNILSVKPVHDYHHVMFHILNVIWSNLTSHQYIQNQLDDPEEGYDLDGNMEDCDMATMDDGQANPSGDANIQYPVTYAAPAPAPILPSIFSPQKHHPYTALNPLEKAIMKYMHHHRSHHVLVPGLAQAIQESTGCTRLQFDLAFQFLLSEAYITSLLDDGWVIITPRH